MVLYQSGGQTVTNQSSIQAMTPDAYYVLKAGTMNGNNDALRITWLAWGGSGANPGSILYQMAFGGTPLPSVAGGNTALTSIVVTIRCYASNGQICVQNASSDLNSSTSNWRNATSEDTTGNLTIRFKAQSGTGQVDADFIQIEYLSQC